MNKLRLSLACAALAIAAIGHADPLVYAQNPDFNGSLASQNDTAGFGNFATVYDNFTLGVNTDLTGAEWIGSYFNPNQAGNITAFTLQIWSDNNGPSASLYSTSVGGNGSETFLQIDNAGDPTYLYGSGISFTATAGTMYWLSIVPDLAFPPQWGWETGVNGDGLSYQDFFGSRTQLGADMSFALFGHDAVPEPAPFAVMGLGLGAMILRRRKKA